MSQLELLTEQLQFTWRYTQRLLDAAAELDWFRDPTGNSSNIAWQVGHLAMAQYGLAIERIRGIEANDAELLPPEFRTWFGQYSRPAALDAGQIGQTGLREVFDRVHEASLAIVATLSESDLDAPILSRPHLLFDTKRGSLAWCARHEMVHAGQIGLLRRQLGADPLW